MSILDYKSAIADILARTAEKEFSECTLSGDDILNMFEYPPDKQMGDLALPCFKMSRTLRCAPPVIAEKLAGGLCDCNLIKGFNATGGYLNIYMKPEYLTDTLLHEILEKGDDYGRTNEGEGKTVLFDYSSPNVAKPFHIGHLGTTVIGHSLKKLHEFAGYKCVGINHLGDWGTQFGKLIVAYRLWGNREAVEKGGIDELVALYVRFHKEAANKPELEDAARAEFTALENGKEENVELWKWFIEISIEEYKKTYAQLGIEFDSYLGESFYSDKIAPVVEELKDKGLTVVDNGATMIPLEEYKMPPCLILKSDGSTLYAARDIAAALYRKKTYDFDKCVYVTSAGQSLHFAQWFRVVGLMGYEWYKDLVHVPYGTVSINGAKLATRSGNVILLKDLFALAVDKVKGIIDEKNPNLENKDEVACAVGVGAIVFHYLSNSRIKDINFMLEDALSFEGNTGPYAQYTYARCYSIIEKAGGVPESYAIPENADETVLELLKILSRFPEAVKDALDSYEPMTVTRYILDVCAAFNRFYHDCQILTDDKAVTDFRVSLTKSVATVLGNALELICMKKTPKI